jgi:hypothetical protein
LVEVGQEVRVGAVEVVGVRVALGVREGRVGRVVLGVQVGEEVGRHRPHSQVPSWSTGRWVGCYPAES